MSLFCFMSEVIGVPSKVYIVASSCERALDEWRSRYTVSPDYIKFVTDELVILEDVL